MKLTNSRNVIVGLLGLLACCGCQSMSPGSTIRGQSPAATPGGEVYTNRHYHQPLGAAADALQDCYHEHHNTDTFYYTAARNGGMGCPPGGGYGAGNCPPNGVSGASYANVDCQDSNGYPQGANGYPQGANGCPPGYDGCPPGGCPGAHCPGLFANTQVCPNGYSYGYQVPNDLRYPQPNAVGGAVVYPYYTHRGPSDFFRTE